MGLLNPMRDKNWRQEPGRRRDDTCDHGLSRRSWQGVWEKKKNVSLLAPGKTDYTACHPRNTTAYILHVVPITTHTHDRRKSIGKKKQRKRKEDKKKEREDKKAKNEKGKERKEKTRRAREGKARRGSKERKRENLIRHRGEWLTWYQVSGMPWREQRRMTARKYKIPSGDR